MIRRSCLATLLLIAAACSGDSGVFASGSVRALFATNVQNNGVLTTSLSEFEGPPLARRRSMPLNDSLYGLQVQLRDPGHPGGFYAWRVGTVTGSPASSKLLRYDASWNVADSISSQALFGQDTLTAVAMRLSADGRFLAVQALTSPLSNVLVLDPSTLAIVRSIPVGSRQLRVSSQPSGTVASQVQLIAFSGCAGAFYWLDLAAGAIADSAIVPCNHFYAGAAGPHRLYLMADSVNAPLMVYDAQSGQRTYQDTLSGTNLIADTTRGEVIEYGIGFLVFADAQTLHVRRVLTFAENPTEALQSAFIDPATGALVAALGIPVVGEKSFAVTNPQLAIIDPAGPGIVALASLASLPSAVP